MFSASGVKRKGASNLTPSEMKESIRIPSWINLFWTVVAQVAAVTEQQN